MVSLLLATKHLEVENQYYKTEIKWNRSLFIGGSQVFFLLLMQMNFITIKLIHYSQSIHTPVRCLLSRHELITINRIVAVVYFRSTVNATIRCLFNHNQLKSGVFGPGPDESISRAIKKTDSGSEHIHMLVYLKRMPPIFEFRFQLCNDETFCNKVLHYLEDITPENFQNFDTNNTT